MEGEKSLYEQYIKFIQELEKNIYDFKFDYTNLVILCVGTDLVVGDSIGPAIGSKLKNIESEFLSVYGDLENTLNFSNAKTIINKIYNEFEKPYIITIDAALGNKYNVGRIILNKGYIKLGKALDKSICMYSNLNINCVVGKNLKSRDENIKELKNVKKDKILEMSEIVSLGIKNVLKKENIYV